MDTLPLICAWLLTMALSVAAALDVTHHATIVATMERLGMPEGFEVIAGVAKAAAALGLITSIVAHRATDPLGAITAWCLVAYFLMALGAHARAKDAPQESIGAGVLFALSLVLAISL
jgi:DoxX-like family